MTRRRGNLELDAERRPRASPPALCRRVRFAPGRSVEAVRTPRCGVELVERPFGTLEDLRVGGAVELPEFEAFDRARAESFGTDGLRETCWPAASNASLFCRREEGGGRGIERCFSLTVSSSPRMLCTGGAGMTLGLFRPGDRFRLRDPLLGWTPKSTLPVGAGDVLPERTVDTEGDVLLLLEEVGAGEVRPALLRGAGWSCLALNRLLLSSEELRLVRTRSRRGLCFRVFDADLC